MGLGMLGIFIVIGMIVGVTYLLNYMFAPKNKQEKKAGVFLLFLLLFVRVNGTMKKKEGAAMEEKARAVKQYLAQAGCPCFVLEKTDSTNSRAREMLLAGAPHGTAVLALSQTKGRGRLDRAFSSEEGGLYLSFIYKKEMPDSAAALTFTVALACAEALESVVDVSVGLKWVNDLYICGKKVGGILTEGVICPQTGKLLGAIIGVGINISNPLPEPLAKTAVSLSQVSDAPPALPALCAAVLFALRRVLAEPPALPIDAYARRMVLFGKTVTVSDGREAYTATVRSLDSQGALVVQREDGTQSTLIAGDVTLHKENEK